MTLRKLQRDAHPTEEQLLTNEQAEKSRKRRTYDPPPHVGEWAVWYPTEATMPVYSVWVCNKIDFLAPNVASVFLWAPFKTTKKRVASKCARSPLLKVQLLVGYMETTTKPTKPSKEPDGWEPRKKTHFPFLGLVFPFFAASRAPRRSRS